MAYRVVSEPAAAPAVAVPDHSKGFPVGTTAKDIGAKVGDEFVVVDDLSGHGFNSGTIVRYKSGKENIAHSQEFTDGASSKYIAFWELATIPPKTAIELQAEEVGIPEPARLVDDDTHLGIKRPDGDGWVKYNAGDVVDLDVVMSVDWVNVSGDANTANFPRGLIWNDGSATHQIAWYRLNYETGTAHVTPSAVNVLVDLGVEAPTTAPDFLQSALNTLTQRGKDYDKPEGERSAAAVAVAFNAITGRNLTEAEVWLVLQLVKDVRQWQNPERYHADSALDCVAYAALKAEALARK